MPSKRFKINSSQAWLKENFNGAQCTLMNSDDPIMGASGETKQCMLPSGGGLYLRDDEVVPID